MPALTGPEPAGHRRWLTSKGGFTGSSGARTGLPSLLRSACCSSSQPYSQRPPFAPGVGDGPETTPSRSSRPEREKGFEDSTSARAFRALTLSQAHAAARSCTEVHQLAAEVGAGVGPNRGRGRRPNAALGGPRPIAGAARPSAGSRGRDRRRHELAALADGHQPARLLDHRSSRLAAPTTASKTTLGKNTQIGRVQSSRPVGKRLVEDRSFADNHRLTTDPNFLENSCTARERNVNTTRAAHADALKIQEPRGIVG